LFYANTQISLQNEPHDLTLLSKFSSHSRKNSSEFWNQCNLASVSSSPDGPSLASSSSVGSAIASEANPVAQESQASLNNELCLPTHLSPRSHKKRRSALPIQESYTRSVVRVNSKRIRSNSSPQDHSVSTCSMAVGGRFKSDSDDDSSFAVESQDRALRRFWVQPAENEPPITLQNHTVLVASPTTISEVDGREMPHLSPKELLRDGFDVVSAVSGEEDLMLARFYESLKKHGLEMVEQEGDGNCLFRAVSLQVYGSSENHSEVRERCLDYMAHNEEHYSGFIAASSDDEVILRPGIGSMTPFQSYIARKRINGVHGNHTEIQALSELFNRPVEVYTPGSCVGDCVELQPINIFHKEYKASDPPIRLSYHDGNHYNAIIDPFVPTAGLGLGLPGLKPGLADQMQLTKAKIESDHLADEMELARVLKESREEIFGKNDDDFHRVLNDSSRDFVCISFVCTSPLNFVSYPLNLLDFTTDVRAKGLSVVRFGRN
jgi:OTU-like cysteine protease